MRGWSFNGFKELWLVSAGWYNMDSYRKWTKLSQRNRLRDSSKKTDSYINRALSVVRWHNDSRTFTPAIYNQLSYEERITCIFTETFAAAGHPWDAFHPMNCIWSGQFCNVGDIAAIPIQHGNMETIQSIESTLTVRNNYTLLIWLYSTHILIQASRLCHPPTCREKLTEANWPTNPYVIVIWRGPWWWVGECANAT